MPSYLSKNEGTYDPGKRYAFTNISEDPFPIKWNGKIVKIVQPHETIEISDATPYPGPGNGDCLARTKAKELATAIILGEARVATEKLGNLHDKSYVSPVGTRAGIPEARKPYEQQILQELPSSENVELLNELKAEEITADMRRQQGVSYSNQVPEFANAPKAGEILSSQKESSIPKASDDVLKAKVGRPKKDAVTVPATNTN